MTSACDQTSGQQAPKATKSVCFYQRTKERVQATQLEDRQINDQQREPEGHLQTSQKKLDKAEKGAVAPQNHPRMGKYCYQVCSLGQAAP